MPNRPKPSFFRCLRHSAKDDYFSGAKEILYTTAFAFMPIYITMLIVFVSNSTRASMILDEMWTTGELLLVSVAMVGPIMYVMFKDYAESEESGFQFPSNWFFVLLILVIVVISSVIFTWAQFNSIEDGFNREFVKYVSFSVTTFIIILVYLIVSVRNMLERQDPSRIMRVDTESFIARRGDR
jgi:hypothetical protein